MTVPPQEPCGLEPKTHGAYGRGCSCKGEPMPEETCTMTLVLDYDSVDCYLNAGHAGPHKCAGEGGNLWWDYAR